MKREQSTKRGPTVFLQAVILLTGIGALVLMLWEPHLEGRNAHATLFEIYFKDPFLAYAYIASIAFFTALFQAFTLLGYIGQNRVVSLNSVRALRIIKYCAIVLIVMIGAAVAYLFIAVRGKDDIAGGVAMGVAMILVSLVIATAARGVSEAIANRRGYRIRERLNRIEPRAIRTISYKRAHVPRRRGAAVVATNDSSAGASCN